MKGEEEVVAWEGRWENLVTGRRFVEEVVGSLIVMKLLERKSSISDWGSSVRVGCSTYPGITLDMPLVAFECDPASVFSFFAEFFFAFNRAFPALRVASSEALFTPLTLLLAGRFSATSRPLSCSFASFFNLLASFFASFESLSSLLFPLTAAFLTSPTSPFIGRTSSVS